MKNPEHESGYFEDGSDVDIASEEHPIGEEKKWCSESFTKAIDELDVRESPASPDPVTQEHHCNKGIPLHFHLAQSYQKLAFCLVIYIYILSAEVCTCQINAEADCHL